MNPITRTATPLSPDTIPDRISEMTFNQSLLKEIRGISMLKAELGTADSSCQVPLIRAISALRFHEIHNQTEMADLHPKSKLFPALELITHLHDLGRRTVEDWLGANLARIGHESTAQFEERYL